MDSAESHPDVLHPPKLASRFVRSFAVTIDGLVGIVCTAPVWWYFHLWEDIKAGVLPTFRVNVILWIIGCAAFAAINFRLLEHRGQTVGKWCMGIAIVGVDGTHRSAVSLLAKRFLPVAVCSLLSTIGELLSLLDACAIFGKERRCLHDRIAGTKVIDIASP